MTESGSKTAGGGHFNIMSWNARGFAGDKNTKVTELNSFLLSHKETVHAVCIQEAFMSNKATPPTLYEYDIATYQKRSGQRGGGTIIYVKKGIKYTVEPSIITTEYEINGITLYGHNKNITIYNCYIPSTQYNTAENYHTMFHNIRNHSVILGDFNIKHPLWNSPGDPRCDKTSETMLNLLADKNLVVLNDGNITRLGQKQTHGDSSLDLALVSHTLAQYAFFGVINNTFGSDHLPIVVGLAFAYKKEADHTGHRYKLGKANWVQYHDFAVRHFRYDTDNKTVEQNHTQFTNAIHATSKKTIPMVTNKSKTRKTVPWWTEACRNAVKQRENARKKYSRKKTQENLLIYRALRNKAIEVIKKAKRTSFEEYITGINHKTTSKEVWDVVNKFRGQPKSTLGTLISDNEPIVMDKDKANVLVQHYKQVSSNDNYCPEFIEKKMAKEQEYDLYMVNHTDPHLEIEYNKPFSLFELNAALNQCNSSAPGDDAIHYEMLKNLPANAKNKLLELYNQSWKEGASPESWGEATIIPILKPNKDKANPASYRPISLTSTLTKVMQRMIKPRLETYIENNNLISPYQSGCRKAHSCEDNLLRFEADCKEAQRKGYYLLSIFLDLSNAFDRHWNKGSLLNLIQLGIKGRMLTWIANFLEGRTIKVKVNGQMSEPVTPDNGTPQGSVISPLIFNLIMNTFYKAIQDHNDTQSLKDQSELAQFVDDGAVWLTSHSKPQVMSKGQAVLDVIEKWSKEWGFTINPSKTQVMMVSRGESKKISKRPSRPLPELKLCGEKLELAPFAKFLGMYFDQQLTWRHHINDLITRCEKDINLLRLLSGTNWGANKKTKLLLYNALIMSKINYGSTAYASANKHLLKRLDTIQAKALKVVIGAYRSTNSMAVLAETAQLPLDITREVNMLKYWARSSRLGETLPINNTIEALKDRPSVIERYIHHKTKFRKPKTVSYAREVPKLIDKYDLKNTVIQKPVYSYNAGIQVIEPDLTLSTSIDKKSNIKLSKIITENHILQNYRSTYRIYTDGSKDPSKNIAGAAHVAFNPHGKEICSSTLKLDPRVSIYTCEATAISSALSWVAETKPRYTTILSDSLSVLQSIKTGRSNTRPDLINKILQQLSHLIKLGLHISLVWIPSHIGIKGNDRADFLAKHGSTNGTLHPVNLAVQEVYSIIKAKSREFFKERWLAQDTMRCALSPDLPSKIQVYSENIRHDKVITRLRLGRNGLGWENFSDRNFCPHCTEYETFNHVFFDIHKECSRNASHRADFESDLLKLGLVCIDRKTLLFPPKDLEKQVFNILIKFISKIGYINKI